MLHTHEVPRERWQHYLALFDQLALDHLVRVEVETWELGDQEITTLAPLRLVELEQKGSDAGEITLTLGTDGESLEHRIAHPSRMWIAHDDAALLQWFAIDHDDGGKTLVQFVMPPMLSGGVSTHA